MIKKHAVLIKYKYLDYIENARLSDADAWIFLKGIIEYDRSKTMPCYENNVLTGLFAAVKLDLDQNSENYEKITKEKSEAGKKGGAPKGNQNARKQSKQTDACYASKNKQNNQNQHDSGCDSGYDSDLEFESDLVSSSKNKRVKKSDGGSKSQQPPQEVINIIKKESEAHGFFIDTKIANLFLNSGIDQTWFYPPFSFLEYCAQFVIKKYHEKDIDELKPLYISAAKGWEDLRDSYPKWEKEELQKKKQEDNFSNLPKCKCGEQTNKTYNNYAQCPKCNQSYEFNYKKALWQES